MAEILFLAIQSIFEIRAAFVAGKATAKTAALVLRTAKGGIDWGQMAGKLRSLERELKSLKTYKPKDPKCALAAAAPVHAVVPISKN
eukprot:scaffold5314_cov64-Phaeocystis_antarctica.AAC.3